MGSKNEATWLPVAEWSGWQSRTRKYRSQRLAVTEANVTWQIRLRKSLSLSLSLCFIQISKLFVFFHWFFLCLSFLQTYCFWGRKRQNRQCESFPVHFLLFWVLSSTKYMWYFLMAQSSCWDSLQSFYRIVWLCLIALIVQRPAENEMRRQILTKACPRCPRCPSAQEESLKIAAIAPLVTAWSLGGCLDHLDPRAVLS